MNYTWVQAWVPSICVVLMTTIFDILWGRYSGLYLKKLVKSTDTLIDDYIFTAFQTPIKYIVRFFGLGMAINFAPVEIPPFVLTVIIVLGIMCLGWGFFRLFSYKNYDNGSIIHYLLANKPVAHADAISNILSAFFRLAIILAIILVILHFAGFDIGAGITQLSIGTALIAFAAKDIFTNFFGSFVILFDEPFKENEWIVADGVEGIVEKITMRSTCIRTLTGERVSVPSAKLANDKIINKSNCTFRRIEMTYNISPGTTAEQVRELIKRIDSALKENEDIRRTGKDIFTYLDKITVLSQDIKVMCYTDFIHYQEFDKFTNLKSEINLAVMEVIRELGIKMALDDDIGIIKGLIKS